MQKYVYVSRIEDSKTYIFLHFDFFPRFFIVWECKWKLRRARLNTDVTAGGQALPSAPRQEGVVTIDQDFQFRLHLRKSRIFIHMLSITIGDLTCPLAESEPKAICMRTGITRWYD